VADVKKINASAIAKARKVRAKRLTQEAWEQAKAEGKKRVRMSDFEVSTRKIDKTDLTFRVMSFDHIPLEPGRKKNPKTKADHHTKVNFPPFQHYKIDKKGKLQCVGKSHWQGGMSNGNFSCDHGTITNELAKMYMKLSERYSQRSNWRGYTYVDEMRSQALMQLSQIGLQFDESKSENPFAYYTAAITNSFTRILNIEKKNQNIRDDILEMNDMMPSYTRQAKNEAEQKESQAEFEVEKAKEKAKKSKKKYVADVAPVKTFTKKAIKALNKKFKKTGSLTAEDFEEVR
tara:strand:- start:5602 stop:6468 length:867 start_codon:yes stop_codon:yes gene_type:complete